MPYKIKHVKGGFKVGKKNTSKTFSKKPQTKKKATAQLHAIEANSHGESFVKKSILDIIEEVTGDVNNEHYLQESTENIKDIEHLIQVAQQLQSRNNPEEIASFLKNRGTSLNDYLIMLYRKLDELTGPNLYDEDDPAISIGRY